MSDATNPRLTLQIAAPTLNRPDRLARMLRSIGIGGYTGAQPLIGYETDPRPLPHCVNDLFRRSTADVVAMVADDVEFLPGSLAALMRHFERGGLDLYAGLNLTNQPPIRDCTEFAFFAVGRAFIERFAAVGYQLFCPDYWHFSSDTELGLYAKSVGRFVHATDARIIHHHPNFSKDAADDTHRASRSRKQQDSAIRVDRRARGLVWGSSWELVTGASWAKVEEDDTEVIAAESDAPAIDEPEPATEETDE